VVHETVAGETIVVNLETGCYYDLNAVGGRIFALLSEGRTVPELAELLAERYDLEREHAERTLGSFASSLLDEQMIAPADDAAAAATSGAGELPADYAEPSFNKYTDMQELLLLDPVHEVDEAGWPHRA
jgi:hypothetical protein